MLIDTVPQQQVNQYELTGLCLISSLVIYIVGGCDIVAQRQRQHRVPHLARRRRQHRAVRRGGRRQGRRVVCDVLC